MAQTYMNKGELVPDEDCANGGERLSRPDSASRLFWMAFHGRTHKPAFDAMLEKIGQEVKVVPYIKVPDDAAGRKAERTLDELFRACLS